MQTERVLSRDWAAALGPGGGVVDGSLSCGLAVLCAKVACGFEPAVALGVDGLLAALEEVVGVM